MMNNNMTKKQLINEVENLRKRITELEKPASGQNKTEVTAGRGWSKYFSRGLKTGATKLNRVFNHVNPSEDLNAENPSSTGIDDSKKPEPVTEKRILHSFRKFKNVTLHLSKFAKRVKYYFLPIWNRIKVTCFRIWLSVRRSRYFKKLNRTFRIIRVRIIKSVPVLKLTWIRIKKSSISTLRSRWGQITSEAAFALLVILLVTYFAGDRTWFLFPEAIIAWVALVLALVIFQAIEENRRLQRDQLKRESRRLLLNELEEWAKEGIRYSMLWRLSGNNQRYEYLVELNVLNTTSVNVINSANSFETQLSGLVKTAAEQLEQNLKNDASPGWERLEHCWNDVIRALAKCKNEVI